MSGGERWGEGAGTREGPPPPAAASAPSALTQRTLRQTGVFQLCLSRTRLHIFCTRLTVPIEPGPRAFTAGRRPRPGPGEGRALQLQAGHAPCATRVWTPFPPGHGHSHAAPSAPGERARPPGQDRWC